jgi:hypothetical protein
MTAAEFFNEYDKNKIYYPAFGVKTYSFLDMIQFAESYYIEKLKEFKEISGKLLMKIIKIETCHDCPFKRQHMECAKTRLTINNFPEFPHWCPLDNAKIIGWDNKKAIILKEMKCQQEQKK